MGPATFRDGVGKVVDPEINPSLYAIAHFGGVWPTIGIAGFMAIEQAGGLDDVLARLPGRLPHGFAAFICKSARRNWGRQSASPLIRRQKPAQAAPGSTVPPNATAAKRNANATPQPALLKQ